MSYSIETPHTLLLSYRLLYLKFQNRNPALLSFVAVTAVVSVVLVLVLLLLWILYKPLGVRFTGMGVL